ncbi:MAG: ABC transporter permease [Treponemataceae bacterium]|nr:ABC transporter permease [Treponemataceae bacterium]
MLKYIGKRILLMIPTIFIMSVACFFIIQLPPGDALSSYITTMQQEGEIVTQEIIEQLRNEYGLDQPWIVQYFKWISNIIFHGEWGYSFEYERPVLEIVNRYMGLTIVISLITMLFTYLVSIPIGIYSALHQYSVGDYIFSGIGFLGMATPNFLLAIILMYLSFVWTGDPLLGIFSDEMLQNGFSMQYFGEFCKRMIIPVVVIGTSGTCGVIRTVRAQMLDELTKQYTLTARAKGVSEKRITYKYCVRAALNPVVSGLAGSLSSIFTGSTISAIVMNLPIQGPVLYKALKAQDMYLAGGILFILAFLVCIGTLLSDIMLAWLDPRIRFSDRS